jgi:tetratricopeptide (TPR) repeat protein
VKELYDLKAVAKLVGISESQIRYWDRIGLIPNVDKKRGTLLFDFKGLVAFRTVKELLNQGISLRRIRKCIEGMKKIMPEIQHPLTEVRISIQGDQLLLGKDNMRFTPDGQLVIDFTAKPGKSLPLTVDSGEESFFRALEAEFQEDWENARRLYERVLALRPDYADARVNLGNIEHRLGDSKKAEQFYRKALCSDPDHLEANYNLANILEERDPENAVLFYCKALYQDPTFADAHFNLARVLDRMGEADEAERHWRLYLDLNPNSEWRDYVLRRLGEDKPSY